MNSQRSVFLKGTGALLMSLAAGLTACQKAQNALPGLSGQNVVRSGDPMVNQSIGDDSMKFHVIGSGALAQAKQQAAANTAPSTPANTAAPAKAKILFPGQLDAAKVLRSLAQMGASSSYQLETAQNLTPRTANSLLLGIPMGLIGQQNIFGGVITQLSDKDSETLGQLKLMDLDPLHVRSIVTNPDTTRAAVTFIGCIKDCNEMSEQKALFSLPILAIDSDNNELIVDLAALGDQMNLVQMLDPMGGYTQLQPKATATIGFDYSDSTLVFDVQSDMIPVDADPANAAKAPVTSFVTRWYLKLSSAFNPAFTSRAPANGVGFFQTKRGSDTKIQRWSMTEYGGNPIKYYLKHIPAEFQPAFAECFDDWNDMFEAVVGRRPITYEFLADNDPRNDLLVTGDIRYNIVEWDLNNKAPYGGLGPSIANQFTGEILSANVLIQGPTIVQLYSQWFKTSAQAADLKAQGQTAQADALMRDYFKSVQQLQAKRSAVTYKVKLGKELEFSRQAGLEDPLAQRNDFDDIPAGYTYETYMPGYFIDMLTHELGHNMGLRHNFRGNLGATSDTALGGTSRSIMEYLGRTYRQVDRLGQYDLMAIQYGYTGKAPEHSDWYCTDEDVASPDQPDNSAECSRDDATADPYSYFENRLAHAVTLLTNPGSKDAPAWSIDDMNGELTTTVAGLLFYASTNDGNVSKLTNFVSQASRPKDAKGIKDYVLSRMAAQICTGHENSIMEKADDASKKKVTDNLTALKAKVVELKGAFGTLQSEALPGCI